MSASGNPGTYVHSIAELRQYLPDSGTNFLWGITGVFLLVFLIVLIFCFTAPESDRVFHYLYVICLLVGAVTYFAQASNYGWVIVGSFDETSSQYSQSQLLFWVKYVYWTVAWPSVSLSLGLLSGLSWVTMLTNLATSWIWVICYLAGAFVEDKYKWGFFAFGTFSWLILTMSTLNEGREAAQRGGIQRDYLLLASWSSLIWVCYPVAYALSDASSTMDTMGGVIFFGILDVLMVPVMSLAFLTLGRGWNFQKLHLAVSAERYNQERNQLKDDSKTPGVGGLKSSTT